jgi:hypothetical protein
MDIETLTVKNFYFFLNKIKENQIFTNISILHSGFLILKEY